MPVWINFLFKHLESSSIINLLMFLSVVTVTQALRTKFLFFFKKPKTIFYEKEKEHSDQG